MAVLHLRVSQTCESVMHMPDFHVIPTAEPVPSSAKVKPDESVVPVSTSSATILSNGTHSHTNTSQSDDSTL